MLRVLLLVKVWVRLARRERNHLGNMFLLSLKLRNNFHQKDIGLKKRMRTLSVIKLH